MKRKITIVNDTEITDFAETKVILQSRFAFPSSRDEMMRAAPASFRLNIVL